MDGLVTTATIAMALATLGYFGTNWSQQRFRLLEDIVTELDRMDYQARCQGMRTTLASLRTDGRTPCSMPQSPLDPVFADLAATYSLIIRTVFWAGFNAWYERPMRTWHVRQIINRSGLRVLSLMSVHRDVASLACLAVGGPNRDFVKAYGLDDARYNELYSALLDCAVRLGLPVDQEATRAVEERIAALARRAR